MKLLTSFLFFFLAFIILIDGVENVPSGGVYLRPAYRTVFYDIQGNAHVEPVQKREPNLWERFAITIQSFLGSAEFKSTLDTIHVELTKLILGDIYNTIIKKGIKGLYMSLKRKIILLKIRKYLRKWWKYILPKLENDLKFSTSKKNRLKRCFFRSGIAAYKNSVLDLKTTVSELFFMTLIEFKNRCITKKFADNHILVMNFKNIENASNFLPYAQNIILAQSHESVAN